jgi:putative SOS response-associated peptidase YedK
VCGRVRLSSDFSEIRIKLKFDADGRAPNYPPDWNIPPPGRMLIVVRSVDGKRVAKVTKWGLIPRRAKDEKIAYSTHNARSEDFSTRPTFRDAWRRGQRCLCVVDGFYEWKKLGLKGNKKQAYSISLADDDPMVMAGLWDTWKSPTSGEEILTCTVLTCEPNISVGELHDRMPVILAEADWPKWLGEEPTTGQKLLSLLRPCPEDALKIWPIDNKVGNVRDTGPQLIRPMESEPDHLI